MDPWEMLGIEPTGEASIIKKAYAKKLKIYHPEDDPEGFQRLRESYDRALKLAKSYKPKEVLKDIEIVENLENECEIQQETINNENEKEKIINDEDISEQEIKVLGKTQLIEHFFDYSEEENIVPKVKLPQPNILENGIDEADKPHSRWQLVYEFMNNVEILYDDFFARIQEESWIQLLDDAIMWNLDCKQLLNNEMLDFLVYSHNIPQNIWTLLNNSFHWDEQEREIYSRYSEKYAKFMFRNLSNEMLPRYCYFSSRDKFNHEEYLEARQKAFDALEQNNLTEAWKYIYIAKEVFAGDPDLWCMEAEYHLKAKNIKKAKIAFEKAEQINPKDMDTIFYKAHIMYNSGSFSETISICKQIKNVNPSDFKVLCLMGKAYVKIRRWTAAREILANNLKVKPNDMETKRSLVELARALEINLRKYPLSFKMRKELKRVYTIIGQPPNLAIFKITPKGILVSIFLIFSRDKDKGVRERGLAYKIIIELIKFIFWASILIGALLLILGLVLGSRGGILIVVFLIKNFCFNDNRNSWRGWKGWKK
ncbi:hypothetical protein rsdtw13_38140 [Clostridium sp. TW13]|uniref:Uncharacterized protein n=2 Tax=Inconstantimicrobium mannanitabidum TaxID=1604901 RepID=A0ACB5RHL1_9CLOT|nr:hypothetical protein rsdtw13_38140 [Clostridium sp. TW13]